MKNKFQLLLFCLFVLCTNTILANDSFDKKTSKSDLEMLTVTAVSDTFYTVKNVTINGNVLANDLSSPGDVLTLDTIYIFKYNPFNGTLITYSNGNFTYIPNNGFSGIDRFSYRIYLNGSSNAVDSTTVYLNVQSSGVAAISDTFNTIPNVPINGNVLSNDSATVGGTLTLDTIYIHKFNPFNGTLTTNSNGNFTYTPNSGFTGVDRFNYRIYLNGSPYAVDSTTVYLNVRQHIDITDTIVLGESYSHYYCLSDVFQYLTDTLNNAVLTTVSDSCFTLYGDHLGTDTITIASQNEIVNLYLTVENGVWPGDTDDDAFVNNLDLLNIGLAYGTTGIARSSTSTLWNGHLVSDWNTNLPSGINGKYGDTDGNGIIDANDTLAIIQNWGLSYNKNGGSVGAPLYLDVDAMTIVNDSIASIPIMLGDAQNPINDIYGLVFTVDYNSVLVKDNSTTVIFDNSWLGTVGTDIIAIDKDFSNNELAEVAVTRIDGNNISGSGQIGKIRFIIQDNIVPSTDSLFAFNITNVTAINNTNTTVDVQGEDRMIHLETISDILNYTSIVDLSNFIHIYPTPATDFLYFEMKDVDIKSVEIYNLTGQKVVEEQNWNHKQQLNISHLLGGLYIINIETNLGMYSQKMMIQR